VKGNDFNYLVSGVEVTLDSLDKGLGRQVEVFIINEIVIRLMVLTNSNRVLEEYPPAEEEISF